MSEAAFRIRRATIDDLPELRALWQPMGFPLEGLERNITCFQIAAAADGKVSGALGLEISGRHGRLYGEAFLDFEHADQMRALMWPRLQLIGANHGVARYWTAETAPYWRQAGFGVPDDAALAKIPEAWEGDKSRWLTLQAFDEELVEKSLAREMAKFRQFENEQLSKTFRRGKALKYIATILAVILAIGVCFLALRVLQNRIETMHH
jgi:N-acetylglutamate synthase-like GNAT family acetyltransferase